jgi:succinate dehydrogenase (ubiquinone) cytochrome b560 subunit
LKHNFSNVNFSWVGSQKVSIQKGDEILNKQRFNRPVAPHLGVYELQQTWFGLSAWMRITGTTLSVASYAFFATYLLAPVIGLHLDTASLVSAFAGLPMMVKSGIKLAISFPFAFHFANGLKQLYSDMGFGFSKRAIKRTDYIIWSAGVLGAMYLTFGM